MTTSTQLNSIPHSPSISGSTQEVRAGAQEQTAPTPLSNGNVNITGNTVSTAKPPSDIYYESFYGSDPVQAPGAGYTLTESEGRIDAYAARVNTQINHIESGSEGERNVKFQNVRLFMEPSGYFSGGLLAAGYDPHEKFTVTFNSYVGMGTGKNLTSSETRTYFAWEIAAGALEHDKPAKGGVVNFNEMRIEPKDQTKINNLQEFGKRLQKHWEADIATPMRGSAAENSTYEVVQYLPFGGFAPAPEKPSTVIPERSGKADAYVARGALQSLRSNKEAFEKLSPAGQEAVSRTLDKNGQVIIPNIYGYPLSGYAFIPYTPYDGNPEHRPNQGVMVDLKNGAICEIKGDDEFAAWAKNNRNELTSRFNASDLQGGKDAHWPPAAAVLDNLILDNTSHYPGRKNLVSDKSVPVRELFNYTESRDSQYELKFGDLNKGIASRYQEVNAKNAVWADQTKVFGAVEQDWKNAKEIWGNTFGYVPILGNVGNIVFGKHDADHGMTASDRVGGTAAAVISSLQLVHELAPYGVEAALGEPQLPSHPSSSNNYSWKYNSETHDFELVRARNASNDSHTPTNVETDDSNRSGPANSEGAQVPVEGTDVKLPPLSSVENLPTGEALFSTGEKAVILSGEVNNLNVINEKLYTFIDINKKGTEQRLNILVHGSVNPETGVARVAYNGQLHTPAELLQTLHAEGIHPELFDNVRLLSCDSASGGDASFAAQFQRLIRRPVKGYTGTLTANLAPEMITAAVSKVEKLYLEELQKQGTSITPKVADAVRDVAEQYVANELRAKSRFAPAKTNPHWNPLKWWAFTYKPVTFTPQP